MPDRPRLVPTGQVEVSFPNRRRRILAVGAGVALGCLYVCLRAACRRWCR